MSSRAAVLALLLVGNASATEITSPTGFRVDLSIPGAKSCVILPERLQNADDCAGLNLPAMMHVIEARRLPPDVHRVAGARVQLADIALVVEILEEAVVHVPTREDLDAFVQSVITSDGSSARLVSIEEAGGYTRTTIGHTPAIRYVVEVITKKGPTRELGYSIFADDTLYQVTVAAFDAAHELEVRKAAEQMMATVSLRAMSPEQQHDFGMTASARRRYHLTAALTHLATAFAELMLLAGFVVLLVRAVRRKRD